MTRFSLASAWHALRYGSTMPMRIALASAAAFVALALMAAPDSIYQRPIFAALTAGGWRAVWVCVFLADAVLLVCRIVDTTPRIWVSRLVNASTCGLWVGYVCVTSMAVGFVGPDDAAEIALAIAAAWCTMRTDYTANDRETA